MVDQEDLIDQAIQKKQTDAQDSSNPFATKTLEQQNLQGLTRKTSKKPLVRRSERKFKKDPEILMNFKKDYLKTLTLPDSNPWKPDDYNYFNFLQYLLPSLDQNLEVVLPIIESLF